MSAWVAIDASEEKHTSWEQALCLNYFQYHSCVSNLVVDKQQKTIENTEFSGVSKINLSFF